MIKSWNITSSFINSSKNVDEGQYGHTIIAFDKYLNDNKSVIAFAIKYTGGVQVIAIATSGKILSIVILPRLFVKKLTKSRVVNQSS